MRTTIFLARALRVHHVYRRKLVLDSRYFAATREPFDVATVYLVREGTLETSTGARTAGPSAWIVAEDQLERYRPPAPSLRLWGEPVVAASLVVPRSRIRAPIGLAHGPVPLPELTWRAFDALPPAGTGAEPAPLVALLERLAADGIVARSVAEDAHHSSPDPLLARLWPKIAERYEKQDSGIYTDLFSVATGASPRQIARAMRTLTGTVLLFGGFRESVRTLRLRRATMLLSAPSLRASEVARMVGYGSVDAMGRAFRDAGLPPPTTIRDHVCADPRDPVDTTSTRSSHR